MLDPCFDVISETFDLKSHWWDYSRFLGSFPFLYSSGWYMTKSSNIFKAKSDNKAESNSAKNLTSCIFFLGASFHSFKCVLDIFILESISLDICFWQDIFFHIKLTLYRAGWIPEKCKSLLMFLNEFAAAFHPPFPFAFLNIHPNWFCCYVTFITLLFQRHICEYGHWQCWTRHQIRKTGESKSSSPQWTQMLPHIEITTFL